MQPTKQKVVTKAEKLFFDHGIANVRLQQIADEAGISVGHLAYHFKNKEAIVTAAYEEVFETLSQMFTGDVSKDDITDLDELFGALFDFNSKYKFCFNNVWEISRNHPAIQSKWEDFLNKKMLLTQKRLAFHENRGILRKEAYKGEYKLLTQQIIFNFHFRIPHEMLKGKKASLKLFKEQMWNLIYPYFTAKGVKEYTKLIKPQ